MVIALQLVGALLVVAAAIVGGDLIMSGMDEALADPVAPDSTANDR